MPRKYRTMSVGHFNRLRAKSEKKRAVQQKGRFLVRVVQGDEIYEVVEVEYDTMLDSILITTGEPVGLPVDG